MSDAPIMLQPGQGQAIWQLGNRFSMKAAAGQTQGRYSLLEQVCTGAPAPMHVHRDETEAFYVLDGSIEVHVDDEAHGLGRGAFCLIPPGTAHSFVSTGDTPARLLVLVSPGGFEQFFAEVEKRFPEANGMPDPQQVGPALEELAAQYGLQIVGPPPH